MNKIIFPIQPSQQGPAVANLQEALLFIVVKRQLTANNLSLAQWKQAVAAEMAVQFSANEASVYLKPSFTNQPRYLQFVHVTETELEPDKK
jgi:hypothetical protein